MLLRVLRQFAAVSDKELDSQYCGKVESQPGRLFFPKHVHELESVEPDAPDGLSVDYLRIAVARNESVWKGRIVDSAVTTLAAHISQQISRAVLLERHLVERLK